MIKPVEEAIAKLLKTERTDFRVRKWEMGFYGFIVGIVLCEIIEYIAG